MRLRPREAVPFTPDEDAHVAEVRSHLVQIATVDALAELHERKNPVEAEHALSGERRRWQRPSAIPGEKQASGPREFHMPSRRDTVEP